MRRIIGTVMLALAAVAVTPPAAAAQYTYVGNWRVSDGPDWHTGPQSYSGREAAALIFGGVFSDYAISTVGDDPSLINFKAFLDGWGDTQYLTNAQSQDFKMQTGASYASGPPAYSAYVYDHACAPGGPYCDPGGGEKAINYAFRVNAVPEPATLALLGTGLLGVFGVTLRRRSLNPEV